MKKKIQNLIKKIDDLSGFTKELYEKNKNEKNTKIFNENEEVGKIFSWGKLIYNDINDFDFNGDFGKILPRGECLNSFIHLDDNLW